MKVDLHLHTSHSADAIHDMKLMIKKAKKKGLKAIAITDHNKLLSYQKAKQLSKQYKIIIIPGIEIGKIGYIRHILALNIKTIPPSHDAHEILEFIDEEGGLSIAPHPFSKLGFSDFETYKFHAVERLNGVNWFSNLRFKSKKPIPQVGNSDAHATYMLGYTYTETEQAESCEQILEQIRKGKCTPKGISIPVYQTMRLGMTLSIYKPIKHIINIRQKRFVYEDSFYSHYRGLWARS